MTEYIISDERLAHINRIAYRAGLSADEVYTQVGADGGEVVRCCDCLSAIFEPGKASPLCAEWFRVVPLDGYCHMGERKDSE